MTWPSHVGNEKGSLMAEAALTMVALVGIVSGGLAICYFSFAHVWLERASYESLICLSTSASVSTCESKIRAMIRGGLPFGRLLSLQLERSENLARIDLRFSVYKHATLHLRQNLQLPLRTENDQGSIL